MVGTHGSAIIMSSLEGASRDGAAAALGPPPSCHLRPLRHESIASSMCYSEMAMAISELTGYFYRIIHSRNGVIYIYIYKYL